MQTKIVLKMPLIYSHFNINRIVEDFLLHCAPSSFQKHFHGLSNDAIVHKLFRCIWGDIGLYLYFEMVATGRKWLGTRRCCAHTNERRHDDIRANADRVHAQWPCEPCLRCHLDTTYKQLLTDPPSFLLVRFILHMYTASSSSQIWKVFPLIRLLTIFHRRFLRLRKNVHRE